VSLLVGHDLGVTDALLEGRSAEERTALFLHRFKAASLVPEATTVGEFHGFLDLMLRHNRLTQEYAPETYPGRIVVLRAEEGLVLDAQPETAHGHSDARESDLGWQRYAAEVEVVPVPGNHVSMMTDPHVVVLAQRLARFMWSQKNQEA